MSKRGYMIIVVSIFTISLLMGIVLYHFFWKEEKVEPVQIAEEKITDECTEEGMLYGEPEETEETNATEEKVSPNANLVLKKRYEDCGHTTKEIVEIPPEMVNKTQEEIEKEYPEFQLEGFSAHEVILLKEEKGYCKEHYMVKEKEGKLAIYTLDEKETPTLKEETEIATEYLPEEDLKMLKEGVKLYGKEQLNSYIEDFE